MRQEDMSFAITDASLAVRFAFRDLAMFMS